MKKTVSLLLILLLLLIVLLGGCTTEPAGPGGTQPPTLTSTPTITPVITTTVITTPTVPANPPRVRILSPEDVGIAGPTNFTVTVAVENFQLVDALGGSNVPGEGHLHYFLDAEAPTSPGVPAIPATGRYAPTANTTYTWTDVPGGYHIVAVELVNNDHTPLVPPATDTITVIVGREGAGGGGGGGGGY